MLISKTQVKKGVEILPICCCPFFCRISALFLVTKNEKYVKMLQNLCRKMYSRMSAEFLLFFYLGSNNTSNKYLSLFKKFNIWISEFNHTYLFLNSDELYLNPDKFGFKLDLSSFLNLKWVTILFFVYCACAGID